VYVISSASFGTEIPAKKADASIRHAVLELDGASKGNEQPMD